MPSAPKPPADPQATARRLPAEWEPHAATWIAWPHNRSDWPGKFGPIPWVYAEIVRRLSRNEDVRILVNGPTHRREARRRLKAVGADMSRVQFVRCKTDRVWTRDSGPSFVETEGRHVAVDWRFNAWAKYSNWQRDDAVPECIADSLEIERVRPKAMMNGLRKRVVLEGGAIDSNGQGTLLTTEECLLSKEQERNPGLDRAGYEAVFRQELGVTNTIWLGEGILGDDTHGHVDDIARFVGPRTVVAVEEPDERDANHARLKENLERLRGARDQAGNSLEIVPLPMPEPLLFTGRRLPASYANFYVANGIVLVPTFNDPADHRALAILGELFPEREIVGIHAVDLVWGFGTLHCMTHEQPAAIGETA